MPRGGKNRKPTALRVLQGTARADRTPKNEPKPRPVAPKAPPWLDPVGKRVWRANAPVLERLGLLTEADGNAFGAFCEAFARYLAAVKRLRTAVKDGATELRPWESSVERALHDVRQLGAEFGWSPGSRSRLSVAEGGGDGEDVLAKLWSSKGG